MTTYTRIRAGDIRPGDFVNRARTRAFFEVTHVEPGPTSVWITFKHAGRARPRKNSIWWKEVRS